MITKIGSPDMATKPLIDSREKILNRFPPLSKLDKSFDKESFEYLSSLPKLNKIVSTLLRLAFFISEAITGGAFLMLLGEFTW